MSKILVVDDMAIFHEPIAAILRMEGHDVLCAASGPEAIQVARSQFPDLILLDVVMPDMDGVTCLASLRADLRTTRIPVVMLTASGERGIVLRSAHLGIQGYILKSGFSKDILLKTIAKALHRPHAAGGKPHAIVGDARLIAFPTDRPAPEINPQQAPLAGAAVLATVRRELELRPVPPVLHFVMQLMRNDAAGLDEIVSMVRQDQALTLRVMKASNSSFYGASKPSRNVLEAVQRIGLAGIRNTIAAIVAMDHFSEVHASGLVPQRFWEHALGTAMLARRIGQVAGVADSEPLFLAGLLHDVGRLLLATTYPDVYKRAMTQARERHGDLNAAEVAAFGLNHADVSGEILRTWRIDDAIITAAALHERDAQAIRHSTPDPQGTLIVAIANRLAHSLGLGQSGNELLLPVADHQNALGLSDESLHAIICGGAEKFQDASVSFACQSEEPLCGSLAAELAATSLRAAHVTVVGPPGPALPLKIFLEQLGWLDDAAPDTAILLAVTEREVRNGASQLNRLEQKLGRPLHLILTGPTENLPSCDEILGCRTATHIRYPTTTTELIAAVTQTLSPSRSGAGVPCPAC